MKTIWSYILKAHFFPFVFAVGVLMFVFLLQFIMKFLDDLAGKGLSAGIISEFIVLNLAWMLILAVPMGVLIASIMAFGRLSSTREIVALRANGVSLYSMMAPTFIASIAVCIGLIIFNNDVLPDTNHRAKMLTTDIYRKKPTLTIVPGLFTTAIQQHAILVRKTFEHSNDLEGVTLCDYSDPRFLSTITAQRGTISWSPDYKTLIMDLYDGEIHEISYTGTGQYRRIRFEKHRTAMPAEGFDFQRSEATESTRGDRELSAHDMRMRVDSVRNLLREPRQQIARFFQTEVASIFDTSVSRSIPATTDPRQSALTRVLMASNQLNSTYSVIRYYERQIREYQVEIHKKYSIPVACIVFILIGAPLGIMSRRGTFGIAASLSLGFFVVYWAFLIQGEKLADRGFIDPWVGMWIANILVGLAGVYLTHRTARETITINWDFFKRFVPKRWRYGTEERVEE